MPECIRSTNLLLLPGMMCDAGLWASQVQAISPICSVFHGDITGDNSIQSIASNVLDGAPQQFALAGLSMGGIVAMEMWRQAPHRIERIALLDKLPNAVTLGYKRPFAANTDFSAASILNLFTFCWGNICKAVKYTTSG